MAKRAPLGGEITLSRTAKIMLFFVVTTAAAITFRQSLLIAMARHLDTGIPPHKVDFVVLLPGHEETRAFVVAGLVKKGYAPTAILIPSKTYGSEQSHVQHVVGRAVLESQGIPADQIIQLPNREDDSTFANAQSLWIFLKEQAPDCRMIVVTNDYHTRRSTWAFRQVLKERMAQIKFVSAPADYHSAETWWHSPRGTEAYLSEYIKLGYYMLRYNRQNRILVLGTLCLIVVSGSVLVLRPFRRRKQKQDSNQTHSADASEQEETE